MTKASIKKSKKSELINVSTHEEKKRFLLIPPEKESLRDFVKWIGAGLGISIVFTILGLASNSRFYAMTPVGIVGSVIGWFIKKFFQKFEDKDLLG